MRDPSSKCRTLTVATARGITRADQLRPDTDVEAAPCSQGSHKPLLARMPWGPGHRHDGRRHLAGRSALASALRDLKPSGMLDAACHPGVGMPAPGRKSLRWTPAAKVAVGVQVGRHIAGECSRRTLERLRDAGRRHGAERETLRAERVATRSPMCYSLL